MCGRRVCCAFAKYRRLPPVTSIVGSAGKSLEKLRTWATIHPIPSLEKVNHPVIREKTMTMTVKAGPLGNMIDVVVPVGTTLSGLAAALVKGGVERVDGKQAYLMGALVAAGADPVLTDGQIVTYNGKIKGN